MAYRPITILLAGIGVNLSVGVLYAWSVFKDSLVDDLGWTATQASTPYSVAIVVFSVATLLAGILQDRIGPRKVIVSGGILVGLGMILSGQMTNPGTMIFTFGIMVGTGIGFAYACVTPAAMKWWHPSRKGMVSGLIVGGFALGAVYVAPLTKILVSTYDIHSAFVWLGSGIIVVSVGLGLTVVNPPAGYSAPGPRNWDAAAANANAEVNIHWTKMIKTRQFYFLFLMFALASSAGVMLIGNITKIADLQVGLQGAVYLVALLAVSNATGRVLGGIFSDKIGRMNTLIAVFVLQAVNMLFFLGISSEIMLIAGAIAGAVFYGALLSVFPSITADYFGLKGYGANYGLVYLGWGLSGALGPIIASISVDRTGSFDTSYMISAAMLIVAAIIGLMTRPPVPTEVGDPAQDQQLRPVE